MLNRAKVLAVALTLAVLATAPTAQAVTRHPSTCRQTFTFGMVARAYNALYRGTRQPSVHDYGEVAMFQRCLRNPRDAARAARYGKDARSAWITRRAAATPTNVAIASWFDDSGATGCGFHTTYGIAALNIPCGARVLLCYSGCVVATREDSGPYVAGRLFDLNPTTRDAIGCTDLCPVRWRLVG